MTALLFDFPDPLQKAERVKPKPKGYTEEFETKIWSPYPRKTNCSKLMAFKAWEKLSPELRIQAIAALPTFARGCVGKEEAYIPHCATWLNQRRFETVRIASNNRPLGKQDWPSIMKLYRITSNWRQDWGPAPNCTGCRVPKELLE